MRKQDRLEHLNQIFYVDLGLCGCGNPEDAYTLVRDLLALHPLYEDQRWKQAEELTGGGAVHHVVMSTLDTADLIEHGSSINGSWLTPKGAWFLNAARDVPFDDIDEAGLPHDGGACAEDCWAA
ncbi:hypothetical protein PV405_08860 [Streptomyces sp. ME02-6979-3A]|uniref:hypothetical protein n=1 Tax=Streptomyces sp. ME02-6979-3A TaxID=3028673 RepID=UPI00299FBF8D|nr:hypothetical protein [Streptomyces sp. ME02-6979-3A]MDX3324777.1 hypothetical protein [Streptomyces sp. ME02-6979-3A]